MQLTYYNPLAKNFTEHRQVNGKNAHARARAIARKVGLPVYISNGYMCYPNGSIVKKES